MSSTSLQNTDRPRSTLSVKDGARRPRSTLSVEDGARRPRSTLSVGDGARRPRSALSAGDREHRPRSTSSAGGGAHRPRSTSSAGHGAHHSANVTRGAGGAATEDPFYATIIEQLDSLRAQLVQLNENNADPSSIPKSSRQNILESIQGPRKGAKGSNDPGKNYPKDCYTLMALNGPKKCRWSLESLFTFMFGLLVFAYQTAFLILLAYNIANNTIVTDADHDNPGSGFFAAFIPANATPITRITQLLSLLAYVMFPNIFLWDLMTAIRLFPLSSNQDDYPVWCMRLSCCLRFCQSILAMVVAWGFLMIHTNAIDILLGFAVIYFICQMNELAFSLAESGALGNAIQNQTTDRVPSMILPERFHLRPRNYCIAMMIALIMVISGSIAIMWSQQNSLVWTTQIFRVQFRDETFQRFSGCFKMSDRTSDQRYIYDSVGNTSGLNALFGYCGRDRRWIFYQDPSGSENPCSATDFGMELAHSPKTDTFDISTSFSKSVFWVSSWNAPLDFFLFWPGMEDERGLGCDYSIGDGICDRAFNDVEYDYDGGDCCASTCSQPNCGRGNSAYVFGISTTKEVSFPYCKDVDMVPITIQLNDITRSQDPDLNIFDSKFTTELRGKTPEDSYFSLYCNGKNVLTAYIQETMANEREIVMVEDGANCTLDVHNSGIGQSNDTSSYVPIWIIDFSIYYQYSSSLGETKKVEILSHRNSEEGILNFRRIPDCYLRGLEDLVNSTSIYNASAVNWLLDHDNDGLRCEELYFTELFALATIVDSMGGIDVAVEDESQCRWPTVTCSEGQVIQIDMESKNLTGSIPTEIQMLTELRNVNLNENLVTSIPSEIGMLIELTSLGIRYNNVSSIPSEVGMLTNLTRLVLSNNFITSLPTEIGLLTKLTVLDIHKNLISNIPSEVGLLRNLTEFLLYDNNITTMPSEIGMLTTTTIYLS